MKSFVVVESPLLPAARSAPGILRSITGSSLQTKLSVGSAADSYEHEADRVADAVVRSPSSLPASMASTITPLAQRMPDSTSRKDDEKHLQKKGKDIFDDKKDKDDKLAQKKTAAADAHLQSTGVPAHVESQIACLSTGGDRMPSEQQSFFQSRFGYDFRDVRIHTGAGAQSAAAALNARAFTVGQHVFFGSGEYRPQTSEGRHLMAHELTHTIQQSAATARASRKVQRNLLDAGKDWVLGKVREFAVGIPGYRLLMVLLGRDPITDEVVERTGENLIHGVLEFVPNGEEIFNNLQASGELKRFLDYFNQQVTQLNLTWESVKSLFKEAWDKLNFTDLASPSAAWEKLKAIFLPPLTRLKNFAVNVGGYILEALKKKVLAWLQDWAKKIRGYTLLTFILGKDPFTDDPVERTPTNFVKAVLELVPGGDKIFENLQKSKTIEHTVQWLNEEIAKLDLTWEKIKALFRKAWDVISVSDVLHPIAFAEKIREIFEAPAIRVAKFALAVGKKILEFIFEGVMMLAGPMGQRVMAIFRKASATFSLIVADPVAFLGHLLDAVKLGFTQFVANIGEYLKEGLIAWLTGALSEAGVVLPKVWDLKGVLSLVLQILGITYAKMRAKVVKALGDKGEKIVSTAEKVWSFLVALVTEGPAAAWQKVSEAIGNLWDMVIGGIKDWAITKIVKVAVTKLVALFNPIGAVIEAVIEIYHTVEFFVKKMNQILALVEAIVDSVANIATGKIAAAANYVEKTLARTIPVMIGFLASLVGLDDISDRIRDVIEALQEKVDKGIDMAIDWIVKQIKALFGGKEEGEHDEKWDAAVAGVTQDVKAMPEVTPEALEAAIPGWKEKYKFTDLKVEVSKEDETWTVEGAMSPGKKVDSGSFGDKNLKKGSKYIFLAPYQADPSNPRRGVYQGRKKTDTGSLLRFTSPDGKEWLAESKEGTKSYVEDPDVGPSPPILQPTMPGRGGKQKPYQVSIDRMGKTSYQAPSEDPYAWDRYHPSRITKRVRGHIINGQLGGPGAYGNLTPITSSDNARMRDGFEKTLRDGVKESGYYYWYTATVSYFASLPSISYPSDFPETITVAYGRQMPVGPNQFVRDPGPSPEAFDITPPEPTDLRDDKGTGTEEGN